MYQTCPKCGHEQPASHSRDADQCAGCGLIFSKWLKNLVTEQDLRLAAVSPGLAASWRVAIRDLLFCRRPTIAKPEFLLYVVIFIAFFIWGLSFISMDFRSNEIGQSWLHNVDLIFHEAGHVIFSPFGRTSMILGGSLFQVLVPLVIVFAFLIANRDGFGAAISLWWCGQSLMDVAPYIADARALRLPLLGGGTGADSPGMHDWANLLRPRGWLEYDIQIAAWVDTMGSGLILLGLTWAGYMLHIYYKDLID